MPSITSIAAAAVLAVAVNGQGYQVAGNWYTNQVNTIQYTNFGSSGSYNAVTNMDSGSGQCSSTPTGYSGSLAPLNGPVSVHFRGPLQLSQFAFYSPSSSSKSKREGHSHHKRHANHADFHAHNKEVQEEKRQVGAEVTVTMNGQVVSWVNEWSGGAAATSVPAKVAAAAAPTVAAANVLNSAVSNVVSAVSSVASSMLSPSSAPSNGNSAYNRAAYYNAASQTAQGLTFLNHMGGQGSGVFDYTFGNSLSYASSNAMSGASTSQILSDMTIPSDNEIVIMSDSPCSNGGCGYTRPGGVAYEGFDGAEKIFLFEFSMPMDGQTGFNGDMPAIWLLNAQIPLTLQYGNPTCSCWVSGCGEFDIMEVLDSGDSRCKSTLHGNVAGGDSAYIQRPTGGPMKLAVVMGNNQATIKVLDSSFDFASGLTSSQVNDLSSSSSLGNIAASIFALA